MIVTSAAVPEVVGTAIVKTAGFFVAATPSSERTSANFGLVTMMPMALAVSIEEPPPMATMQSAFAALNALTPALTFSIVGLGLMSEKISNLMPAFFSRSVTFAVVPIFTRTGAERDPGRGFVRSSAPPGRDPGGARRRKRIPQGEGRVKSAAGGVLARRRRGVVESGA